MKRKDLLKRLKEIGELDFVREGGEHTVYRANGSLVSVPRHKEINEITAKAIIKVATGKER